MKRARSRLDSLKQFLDTDLPADQVSVRPHTPHTPPSSIQMPPATDSDANVPGGMKRRSTLKHIENLRQYLAEDSDISDTSFTADHTPTAPTRVSSSGNLSASLKNLSSDLQNILRAFDESGDGTISRGDFDLGIQLLGHHSKRSELESFLNKNMSVFVQRGRIKYRELLSFIETERPDIVFGEDGLLNPTRKSGSVTGSSRGRSTSKLNRSPPQSRRFVRSSSPSRRSFVATTEVLDFGDDDDEVSLSSELDHEFQQRRSLWAAKGGLKHINTHWTEHERQDLRNYIEWLQDSMGIVMHERRLLKTKLSEYHTLRKVARNSQNEATALREELHQTRDALARMTNANQGSHKKLVAVEEELAAARKVNESLGDRHDIELEDLRKTNKELTETIISLREDFRKEREARIVDETERTQQMQVLAEELGDEKKENDVLLDRTKDLEIEVTEVNDEKAMKEELLEMENWERQRWENLVDDMAALLREKKCKSATFGQWKTQFDRIKVLKLRQRHYHQKNMWRKLVHFQSWKQQAAVTRGLWEKWGVSDIRDVVDQQQKMLKDCAREIKSGSKRLSNLGFHCYRLRLSWWVFTAWRTVVHRVKRNFDILWNGFNTLNLAMMEERMAWRLAVSNAHKRRARMVARIYHAWKFLAAREVLGRWVAGQREMMNDRLVTRGTFFRKKSVAKKLFSAWRQVVTLKINARNDANLRTRAQKTRTAVLERLFGEEHACLLTHCMGTWKHACSQAYLARERVRISRLKEQRGEIARRFCAIARVNPEAKAFHNWVREIKCHQLATSLQVSDLKNEIIKTKLGEREYSHAWWRFLVAILQAWRSEMHKSSMKRLREVIGSNEKQQDQATDMIDHIAKLTTTNTNMRAWYVWRSAYFNRQTDRQTLLIRKLMRKRGSLLAARVCSQRMSLLVTHIFHSWARRVYDFKMVQALERLRRGKEYRLVFFRTIFNNILSNTATRAFFIWRGETQNDIIDRHRISQKLDVWRDEVKVWKNYRRLAFEIHRRMGTTRAVVGACLNSTKQLRRLRDGVVNSMFFSPWRKDVAMSTARYQSQPLAAVFWAWLVISQAKGSQRAKCLLADRLWRRRNLPRVFHSWRSGMLNEVRQGLQTIHSQLVMQLAEARENARETMDRLVETKKETEESLVLSKSEWIRQTEEAREEAEAKVKAAEHSAVLESERVREEVLNLKKRHAEQMEELLRQLQGKDEDLRERTSIADTFESQVKELSTAFEQERVKLMEELEEVRTSSKLESERLFEELQRERDKERESLEIAALKEELEGSRREQDLVRETLRTERERFELKEKSHQTLVEELRSELEAVRRSNIVQADRSILGVSSEMRHQREEFNQELSRMGSLMDLTRAQLEVRVEDEWRRAEEVRERALHASQMDGEKIKMQEHLIGKLEDDLKALEEMLLQAASEKDVALKGADKLYSGDKIAQVLDKWRIRVYSRAWFRWNSFIHDCVTRDQLDMTVLQDEERMKLLELQHMEREKVLDEEQSRLEGDVQLLSEMVAEEQGKLGHVRYQGHMCLVRILNRMRLARLRSGFTRIVLHSVWSQSKLETMRMSLMNHHTAAGLLSSSFASLQHHIMGWAFSRFRYHLTRASSQEYLTTAISMTNAYEEKEREISDLEQILNIRSVVRMVSLLTRGISMHAGYFMFHWVGWTAESRGEENKFLALIKERQESSGRVLMSCLAKVKNLAMARSFSTWKAEAGLWTGMLMRGLQTMRQVLSQFEKIGMGRGMRKWKGYVSYCNDQLRAQRLMSAFLTKLSKQSMWQSFMRWQRVCGFLKSQELKMAVVNGAITRLYVRRFELSFKAWVTWTHYEREMEMRMQIARQKIKLVLSQLTLSWKRSCIHHWSAVTKSKQFNFMRDVFTKMKHSLIMRGFYTWKRRLETEKFLAELGLSPDTYKRRMIRCAAGGLKGVLGKIVDLKRANAFSLWSKYNNSERDVMMRQWNAATMMVGILRRIQNLLLNSALQTWSRMVTDAKEAQHTASINGLFENLHTTVALALEKIILQYLESKQRTALTDWMHFTRRQILDEQHENTVHMHREGMIKQGARTINSCLNGLINAALASTFRTWVQFTNNERAKISEVVQRLKLLLLSVAGKTTQTCMYLWKDFVLHDRLDQERSAMVKDQAGRLMSALSAGLSSVTKHRCYNNWRGWTRAWKECDVVMDRQQAEMAARMAAVSSGHTTRVWRTRVLKNTFSQWRRFEALATAAMSKDKERAASTVNLVLKRLAKGEELRAFTKLKAHSLTGKALEKAGIRRFLGIMSMVKHTSLLGKKMKMFARWQGYGTAPFRTPLQRAKRHVFGRWMNIPLSRALNKWRWVFLRSKGLV